MGQLLTVPGTTGEKLLTVWNSWCQGPLTKNSKVSRCGYQGVQLLHRWVLRLPLQWKYDPRLKLYSQYLHTCEGSY